ncbi:MAG: RNase adapter RapZ, partial [Microbacteriaceae bacterium]
GTLLDGITAERNRLSDIRAISDIVIDTSELNVHQLARTVLGYFGGESESKVSLTLLSFGFKYGAPTDADMIIDARFLPNPYWIPELRNHTGLDPDVSQYILEQPYAKEFLENFAKTLNPVLSGYAQENKRHATIAIGCTGGKHRSVAMTEELSQMLANRDDVVVSIRHRDLGRE